MAGRKLGPLEDTEYISLMQTSETCGNVLTEQNVKQMLATGNH